LVLTALMVGMSIGLLYVIVPAPIDLVAAQRGLRFGTGAGIAAQLGSMAADGLCAVLALGALAQETTNPRLQMPIVVLGLTLLALVTTSTIRAMFHASNRPDLAEMAIAAQPPYLVHALWGAVATVASPFPLAYWTALGASLARFSAPERWVVGAGFLMVDIAWAICFPMVVAVAPQIVPPALHQRVRVLGSLATVGIACFFGMQLASTVA
jgi:threonine/homoserine/homoserine lactone efflux protein